MLQKNSNERQESRQQGETDPIRLFRAGSVEGGLRSWGNLPSLSTWPELLEAGHVSLPFFVVLAFGAKMKESVSDSGRCQAGVWDKKAPHPGTTEPESEYIQRDRPGFIVEYYQSQLLAAFPGGRLPFPLIALWPVVHTWRRLV